MTDDILRALTYDDALALVGKSYRIAEKNIELIVTSVRRAVERGPRPKEVNRDGFSIFFRGPSDVYLPQRMYDLSSDSGAFPGLFIVPVGRNAQGIEYEAVFT